MITELIEKYFGIAASLQNKLFFTFIIILISWLLQKTVIRFFVNKFDDLKVRFQWKKTVKYIIVFFTIIFLARTWFGAFDSIGTYFGLLSAGLAIALQDLLVNLAGWIFILFRKPFNLGDRIEIDNIVGDVIDQRVFQFSVIEIGNWVDADQSTGRIIHIPNGKVFKMHQANYTAGFEYIWHEIPVLLTFESDWKNAKEILLQAVNKHAMNLSKEAEVQIKEAAKTFLIFYKTLTPIVYTTVKDSGVLLTIRYLAHVRRRRMTEELIWEEVLDQFAKYENIDFAYPTIRYYSNITEGKEGTKPK